MIVWIRRDLRVRDNTALIAAAATGAPVLPLFIFDRDLIRTLPSDGAAFNFQAEALRDLQDGIAALGGRLILRHGTPRDVHRQIIRELQPAGLYFHRDYESYGLARDADIFKLYEQHDIPVHTFADIVLQEPPDVLTPDGRPYVVFTPYANAWKKRPVPPPAGMPARFTTPDAASEAVLDAAGLRKPVRIPEPAFRGGEREAERRWTDFLQGALAGYATGRDTPAEPGTSRMSPYLRFGCISARRLHADARTAMEGGSPGASKFIDELIWREFYQAVLFHFPRLRESNYREEFDRMPWSFNDEFFTAWREGHTGYPLVDAGMRELNRTGWMHNRVRMVVASFLTKDLHHDWRLGEKVFEEKLLDIETASNNGGWQWSASTGVDPRPLRIFNPRLQAERYDPSGAYIRRFVPELARVPDRWIHAPQEMPPLVQQECGCIIGQDYPVPIVDHAAASLRYKELFAGVKEAARR
jgi:deoxyribodipyrimidine photo-lyase